MVYALFLILHVVISVLLMVVVLLQSGRGGGLASAFGAGGGNQTLFGGRGATTFLTKATWILGAGFMVTSLLLAVLIGNRQGTTQQRSVLRDNPAASAPVVPGSTTPSGGEAQTPPSGGGTGN